MNRLALVLLIGGAAGCGAMAGLMPVEREEVEKANEQRDLAKLDAICNGDKRVRYDSDRDRACTYAKRHRVAEGECDTLVERYEGTSKDWKLQRSMAGQFAECGMYEELFEKVVHWGNNNEGVKLLAELEADGYPVEAELVKYAETHQGADFMSMGGNEAKFAVDYIGKWLIQKGSTGHCELFAEAAAGANETARVWLLPYFRGAECTEAAPLAVALLSSDQPSHRLWACRALGEIGGPEQLEPMHIVAESDGYSRVREEERDGRIWAVKEWPVRDACKQAHGKVRLTGSSAAQ